MCVGYSCTYMAGSYEAYENIMSLCSWQSQQFPYMVIQTHILAMYLTPSDEFKPFKQE